MNARNTRSPSLTGRLTTPILVVTLFVLALSACVLGLVVWKGYEARQNAIAQSETELRNLAHSLAEHASHTFQTIDIAIDDVVTSVRQQTLPDRQKFDARLREIVDKLDQISDLMILDRDGDLRYASLASPPSFNNADREYFIHHRDSAAKALQITGPILSRHSGRPIIALTRRIDNADGSFGGVVLATIERDYFTAFYKTLDLGRDGAITLAADDGRVMIRWPAAMEGRDLANSVLLRELLPHSPKGYSLEQSPFDGLVKYYAYERVQRYPLVVTVARTEDSVLARWREGVRSDTVVATAMLACIVLLAAVLAGQLRNRQRFDAILRERDARHRLIDANIADVVVLLDDHGVVSFVSESAEGVLGFTPDEMVGRPCMDMLYPDDVAGLRAMGKHLANSRDGLRAEFRMERTDGTLIWLEANFRFTRQNGRPGNHIVCTLRDVTRRKAVEDEVDALNCRLTELARTDGLTGLPNRRAHEEFLEAAFKTSLQLSVVMIDVDYFKGFNDCLGHQAGDQGLKLIGSLLAAAAAESGGHAARYGGEEFAIVLPGSDIEAAMRLAQQVRRAVRQLGLANPASPAGYLTVSIGVASRTAAMNDPAKLVRDADMALYQAKRSGRNRSIAAVVQVDDATPLVPDEAPGPTTTTSPRGQVPNA
ncbi:diguanylate cyclase [Rhodopseudomonas palustris]|uniref:diguanylate cyclase n=1 Tax=Rhodopseudomonas palustris TaxID=1076 RepID=A0A418VG29_RHOPL|nr:diguanylate cyclase [Rhodopseudomonas palustris]RJF75082.1 diguanylate cyclase [Rhodopseudomonas palustris]